MACNPYYIYDLPYQARRDLCRILDADRRWEELGGIHMRIDVTTLTLIGQAIQREKSPTNELLSKWGEINGTITEVFLMLAKMDHQRAMSVMEPYVDSKYHKLLRKGKMVTSSFKKCFDDKDLPRPHSTCSSMISMASNQNVWQGHKGETVMSKELGACGNSISTSHSKLINDTVNLNQSLSSVSLQSKLNCLNYSHSKSKVPQGRKSSDPKQSSKDNANDYAGFSLTDNSAWPPNVSADLKQPESWEKLKNVRRSSFPLAQGVSFNGKNLKHNISNQVCGSLSSLEDSLPAAMQITYKEILKATDEFSVARILGRGGFGTVYKGEWKGAPVAIKRLLPREGHDSASRQLVSLKQSINELKILYCCRFDNILPLYGVCLDGPEPCLVYQLMVNGSLEDRLLCKNGTPPLTWSQRSNIAECTAKGLNYLHTTPEKPLVHGDIKSANILLDSNMEARIGDFGLTREGPGCQNTHVKVSSIHGTQFYLPPEYLRQHHLSPKVDVYSYGIVLLEIATGLRPYDDKRGEAKLLMDYVSDCNSSGRLDSLRDIKAGEENMMWFRDIIEIGQKCSSREKKKRPPMTEILEHFINTRREISMMDKVRRLSEENIKPDDMKLKQLSPKELQMYYDMCKNKTCMNVSEGSSPPKVQNDNSLCSLSSIKDIRAPPADSSFHPSDIRAPPSSDSIDSAIHNPLPIYNSSCSGEWEGRFRSDQLSEGNQMAPIPAVTLLNLQASELTNNSQDSYPSAPASDIMNGSVSNDYNRNSSLHMMSSTEDYSKQLSDNKQGNRNME